MTVTPAAALDQVDLTARALLRSGSPILLAVSGGCDSMVLMHAVARALGDARVPQRLHGEVGVLTFDHGTGAAASDAAAFVEAEGTRLGFTVRRGSAALPNATEAEWRSARWRFFRDIAASSAALIATAHTRDDQLETVVMRAMRGAGARGLAALAARTPGVARPFLTVPRASLRLYAREWGIGFREDPSNVSRSHLRNRVRHDLLPAILRLRPGFGGEMLAVAERAADWRERVEALAARFVGDTSTGSSFRVARAELATYDSASLCALWPAIAAHAGVTLDRRGTLRLAQFTRSSAAGARIQLSGGIEVLNVRDAFVLQRAAQPDRATVEVPLAGVVEFGEWRFAPAVTPNEQRAAASSSERTQGGDVRAERRGEWTAELPTDGRLVVRAWRPGDRMRAARAGAARRVKRFLADARVPGPNRVGWPVVLWEDEIVWIPGIRRSRAAPERSGRPTVRYTCERFDSGLPGG